RCRLHSRRHRDRHGYWEGRGPVLSDRHRPPGGPAGQDPRRTECVDGVRTRRTESVGRVARPTEGCRTVGHSPGGPDLGPPGPAADPEYRAGQPPPRHPRRAVPRWGGPGVAPGRPGRRTGRGPDPEMANDVDRGVEDGNW